MYVVNCAEGDACGVIRAIKIGNHGLPTADQVEQALREEINLQLPFMVQICIMPVKFKEFWQLMWSRKAASQQADQSNLYDFYKWKL